LFQYRPDGLFAQTHAAQCNESLITIGESREGDKLEAFSPGHDNGRGSCFLTLPATAAASMRLC